jgi:hypothetical protein
MRHLRPTRLVSYYYEPKLCNDWLVGEPGNEQFLTIHGSYDEICDGIHFGQALAILAVSSPRDLLDLLKEVAFTAQDNAVIEAVDIFKGS